MFEEGVFKYDSRTQIYASNKDGDRSKDNIVGKKKTPNHLHPVG